MREQAKIPANTRPNANEEGSGTDAAVTVRIPPLLFPEPLKSATGRDALQRDPALLPENVQIWKLMGKRLESQTANAFPEAAKKGVYTCNAGRAGARPYHRRRSGSPIISKVHDQLALIFSEI